PSQLAEMLRALSPNLVPMARVSRSTCRSESLRCLRMINNLCPISFIALASRGCGCGNPGCRSASDSPVWTWLYESKTHSTCKLLEIGEEAALEIAKYCE